MLMVGVDQFGRMMAVTEDVKLALEADCSTSDRIRHSHRRAQEHPSHPWQIFLNEDGPDKPPAGRCWPRAISQELARPRMLSNVPRPKL